MGVKGSGALRTRFHACREVLCIRLVNLTGFTEPATNEKKTARKPYADRSGGDVPMNWFGVLLVAFTGIFANVQVGVAAPPGSVAMEQRTSA